ncbi:MAG: sulfocyanin-like copper-binding protein [Candidatus Dormibacteraceae bacterium]
MLGAILAAPALASCGEYVDKFAPTPPPSTSAQHPSTRFFSYDRASRTVILTLIAGSSASDNAFNFDGYSGGAMTVSVPAGWTVTVQCANRGTVRHSCVIVRGHASTTPAFPGASSPDPTRGLPPGGVATFHFTPTVAGDYLVACLVPGHQDAGMWDRFQVTRRGLPSIGFPPA